MKTIPQKIGVLRRNGNYSAVAVTSINAGDIVCDLEGINVARPTRYTIQIGENLHLGPPENTNLEQLIDLYPWRFMNHACQPNARVDGRHIVAMTSIQPGEEITFNYNTTESALAEPFTCTCGAADCCRTLVRGFEQLSASEKDRLRPWLADYLANRLDKTSAAT